MTKRKHDVVQVSMPEHDTQLYLSKKAFLKLPEQERIQLAARMASLMVNHKLNLTVCLEEQHAKSNA